MRAASFSQGMTKREIVDKWGDRLTSDGIPLSEMLASLPDNQPFDTPEAVVDKLAEQDVALIKGLGGEDKIRGSVGIAAEENVANAKIDRVEGVTPQLSTALASEGVKTVGDLKNMSSTRIMEIGRAHGVDVSAGVASGLLARGKVIGGL